MERVRPEVTLKQLQRLLDRSVPELRYYAQHGRLPCYRSGVWLMSRKDAAKLARERRNTLSIKEAADLLGTSECVLKGKIRRKKIRAFIWFDGRFQIPKEDVEVVRQELEAARVVMAGPEWTESCSMGEASELLSMSKSAVTRRVSDGRLVGVIVHDQPRVTRASIDAYQQAARKQRKTKGDVSAQRAAKVLGKDPRTLLRWLSRGWVKYLPGTSRIDRGVVIDLIRNLRGTYTQKEAAEMMDLTETTANGFREAGLLEVRVVFGTPWYVISSVEQFMETDRYRQARALSDKMRLAKSKQAKVLLPAKSSNQRSDRRSNLTPLTTAAVKQVKVPPTQTVSTAKVAIAAPRPRLVRPNQQQKVVAPKKPAPVMSKAQRYLEIKKRAEKLQKQQKAEGYNPDIKRKHDDSWIEREEEAVGLGRRRRDAGERYLGRGWANQNRESEEE